MTSEMHRKISTTVGYFAVSLILTCAVVGGYWYFEPAPSWKYSRTLLTPEVEQGSQLRLAVDVYWTKSCYSKLYRNIIDGGGKIIPFAREIRPNYKGHFKTVIVVTIPRDATPGPARWEVRTEWFCNPLQNYWPNSVELDPVHFYIVPEGSSKR